MKNKHTNLTKMILACLLIVLFNSCNQTYSYDEILILKNDNNTIEDKFHEQKDTPIQKDGNLFIEYFHSIPKIENHSVFQSNNHFKHINYLNSEFMPEGAALLGRLDAIKNKYPIIYTYPADIRLPILEIYTSNGKKMDEIQLFDYHFCMDFNSPENLSQFKIISSSKIELLNLKENKNNLYDTIKVQTINLLD